MCLVLKQTEYCRHNYIFFEVKQLFIFRSKIKPSTVPENSSPSTHREIKPKSDCIYHAPIDLEPNGRPFTVPNQSESGK